MGGGGGGGLGGRLNPLIHGDLFGTPSQYFPKYDLVKMISFFGKGFGGNLI